MLNPQFLKDVIPGDFRPYHLTLPTQQCLSYIMSEKRILDYDKEQYARRTTAEPGGTTTNTEIASDGGVSNLKSISQQTLNASENNLIASTATDRPVTKTHTVQRGENIRNIAKLYGVSATDIKRWNKLRGGKVREGDNLIIEVSERVDPDEVKVTPAPEIAQATPDQTVTETPVDTQTTQATPQESDPKAQTKPAQAPKPAVKNTQQTSSPKTTTHVVKKGDTLSSIARKYSTTVAAIQAANGMKPSQTGLQINQKLKIPSKGASVSPKSSTSKSSRSRKPARR